MQVVRELEGDPFFADPREVLRQVVARFTEMELTIVAAFELEFYLIDQENVNGRPQPPRSPISGKRPQSVQVYSIDDLDEYVSWKVIPSSPTPAKSCARWWPGSPRWN